MSADGAEGAGSMMIDGSEGSGSFEAMAGDASAIPITGLNPTRLSPVPPTMAAAASNRLVLMADPCLGDRRVRRFIEEIVLVGGDELRRLADCGRKSAKSWT
jgi:hypothetical protein